MKKILKVLMVLTMITFIPIDVYAVDKEPESKEIKEEIEKEEVQEEKVEFVQCDDSKSAKFRNKDNELINVKLLGISVPDKIEDETYEFICDTLEKSTDIKLEYDSNSEETDSYGRRYAWVFVDDLLLQDMLVKEGYANISSQIAEYKYMDDLKLSLEEAKQDEKGIWKKVVEEIKNDEENEEKKEKPKGFFKQIMASVLDFIDGILDGILKFIESML